MLRWWFVLSVFPVLAAAAGPRDKCTSEQTILRKALGNRCFDELIAKTTNPEDRAWLLGLAHTWNPDPLLKLRHVPGGLVVLRGKKRILDARIIFTKPLVMEWNGKIVQRASLPKTTSLKKFLEGFINGETHSASLFLPAAYAQTSKDPVRDIATMYFMNSGAIVDAEGFIRAQGETNVEIARLFPKLTRWEYNWSGKTMKCSNGGLEDITYDYNDDKWLINKWAGRSTSGFPVTIRTIGPRNFEIVGLFGEKGEKKAIAEYKNMKVDSDQPQNMVNAQTVLGDNYLSRFDFYVCEDKDCQKRTKAESMEKLMASQRKDFGVEEFDLEPSMMGAAVLADCCRQEKCRAAAMEILKIKLEPSEESSSTK